MMKTPSKPPALEALRTALRPICETHPVARMQVFGSVARGTPHFGSDVDLLVEFLPGVKAGLFEMGALKEDIEDRLGCRVDLLSRNAVEKSRNPIRRRAILSAPLTLYAR